MRIRIVVPTGRGPQWVREQWVGVEMPVVEFDANPGNKRGYIVGTSEAIQALEKKSPDAAAWWKAWRVETVAGQFAAGLVFAREVCEEI